VSPNIIRELKSRIRWVEDVAAMKEMRNPYSILVRPSEEKRQFRRPRHRWKDNIRMDLKGIVWEDV
jgi:hypothetical protein